MKYLDFRKITSNYPFFRTSMLFNLKVNFAVLQTQLSNWTAKDYLIKLNKNLYTLNDEDRKAKFSNFFIANQIYKPSYISLESALSFYGFIPERIDSIISVSTKKTQRFKNKLGSFIYHSLKPTMFDDFIQQQDEYGNNFFIASPEKALIDFLYFRTRGIIIKDKNIFDLSYRLQHLDTIDIEKLRAIAKKAKQKRLIKTTELLIEYINDMKIYA